MTEAAKKHRDELATVHMFNFDDTLNRPGLAECGFREGFNAGYAYQEERLKIAIEALEQIGSECFEDMDHQTIFHNEATEYIRLANASLAKIRGEK